jgi:hypothetical protein
MRSKITAKTTPSSSSFASGAATNTGSPGEHPSSRHVNSSFVVVLTL